MANRNRKSNRIKFGIYSNSDQAQVRVDKHRELNPDRSDIRYFITKLSRPKEGMRSYLAYALVDRSSN